MQLRDAGFTNKKHGGYSSLSCFSRIPQINQKGELNDGTNKNLPYLRDKI